MEKVNEVTNILVEFAKDLVNFVKKVLDFFESFSGDEDDGE